MDIISSFQNQMIKEVKSLYRKNERWKRELYVLEGIKVIDESIDSNENIKYVLYSEHLFSVDGGKEILEKLSKRGIKIFNITDKLMRYISDMESPQGIIGVNSFNLKTLNYLMDKENKLLVILDEIQDPGNLGTIIRTCDAFGCSGVILTEGCVDVYNPKVIRSTMGSIFHIPISFCKDKNEIIRMLKKHNVDIYTTSLDGSISIYDADFKRDLALVIGNESKGVSNIFLDEANLLIKIPMVGKIDSLNVAIASSIIMYEALKQRL